MTYDKCYMGNGKFLSPLTRSEGRRFQCQLSLASINGRELYCGLRIADCGLFEDEVIIAIPRYRILYWRLAGPNSKSCVY